MDLRFQLLVIVVLFRLGNELFSFYSEYLIVLPKNVRFYHIWFIYELINFFNCFFCNLTKITGIILVYSPKLFQICYLNFKFKKRKLYNFSPNFIYDMNFISHLVPVADTADKLFLILKINKMHLHLYKNLK